MTRASEMGTLHFDTKGKIETPSINGPNYFASIIDEYSRYTAVRPIKSKADASDAVLRFVRFFERQTGCTVRKVHTYGGSEFKPALDRLEERGVQVSITSSYTPESNGLAERTNQTILGLARTCLKQAKLPLQYWSYAVRHVADCKNMVTHSATKTVPLEIFTCRSASAVTHLRPFGCRMSYRPGVQKLGSFEARMRDGICLYHDVGGIYLVLTVDGVIRTKHVQAQQSTFPGLALFSDGNHVLNDSQDRTVEIDARNHPRNSDRTTALNNEALTYIPAMPSAHGESDNAHPSDVAPMKPRNTVRKMTKSTRTHHKRL